jgi:hypothetical protein
MDVHGPMETNLLLDAIREVIVTSAQLCDEQALSD